MNFIYEYTSPILSFFTLILNLFSVLILIVLFTKNKKFSQKIFSVLGRYALEMGLVVAIGSVVGSLIYSNIIGFEPCILCWWERLFIYPQVVILAIGIWLKDRNAFFYSFVFSALTIILSGYHTFIQLFPNSSSFCGGLSVSCSKVYFIHFGYITIPTMALSAGIFFMLIAVLYRQYKK